MPIPSTTYRSQAELGKRYRDTETGYEGVATAISFFQHGCERVSLEQLGTQGRIVVEVFDAPRLQLIPDVVPKSVTSEPRLQTTKTGGPDRVDFSRPAPQRHSPDGRG